MVDYKNSFYDHESGAVLMQITRDGELIGFVDLDAIDTGEDGLIPPSEEFISYLDELGLFIKV